MFFGGGGRCDVLGGLLLGNLGVSLPLPGRGALPVESIFYTRVTLLWGIRGGMVFSTYNYL